VPALGAVGVFLFWGLSGLPPFGHYHGRYGHLINGIALPQRHATNAVTAVVFDYRGFDTLGEEFILFAAVMGVVLLLRKSGSEREPPGDFVRSDQLRLLGGLFTGVVLLIGVWLVSFGMVTPGGGFQGGVVIAASTALLYLATSYRAWHRVASETVLDPIGGIGVGGYTIVGLAALLLGLSYLKNLFGPGIPGTIVSGGSMPLLNWGTALEVSAANVVLYAEFLEQFVMPLVRRRRR
jgi:multicomponent Na+:H+ antiporter subunit B